MSTNKAAWILTPKADRLVVQDAPYPNPGPGEVVIRSENKYPLIPGADVAGVVHEVGAGVGHLKQGQRVMGYCMGLGLNDNRFAAYQHYCLVHETLVAPVPDHIKLSDAVVLPLAITTVSASLYHPDHLSLPLPQKQPVDTGKTILVWGGSSSVGATAIQFLVASGFKVIATASKHNHSLIRSLGASKVLDYNSPSIIDEAVATLQNHDLAACYDAISEPQTMAKLGAILDQLGPCKTCFVVPPRGEISKNIRWTLSLAFELLNDKGRPIADHIWHEFVPKALRDGQLQTKPEPVVVGNGLEGIQEGLEKLQKGVSAQKYIIQV
ncbi:Zinc-binding alcohol dehydrogenase domain-containing cipB [Fusarium acutatum]|uniref:Zinc-binding alcohol dehydrogenase domain-containing cipB n=1 Tax=Fusarium acutatum TaxID=78861 RepID=A0A8H4JLG7_9HYPO|nr:Zinc-binding alcohol dehydrogenase domain-containing cipB [Fusarium acutatum]